ncbi:alpha/beta fold hydrolase [Mycoplasmopsis pulmonis]|nr:alpha/beta hydrolase [Mycoplasmopsis pulmonis]MDZ7293718.1 alpha/beta hydrolase [Mycoplasmopsis pulmonis]VEU67825.1 esterase/lipase [Mycoplasmopsis pulmonis]
MKILNFNLKYFLEQNEKPLVLFIHGFKSSHKAFAPIVNMPNRDFDIVSIDLPFHGETTLDGPLQQKVDLKFLCEFTAEFLKQKNLKPALVVGHSLGGLIALSLVEKELVDYGLLLAPLNYLYWSSPEMDKLKRWFIPQNLDDINEMLLALVSQRHPYFKTYSQSISRIAKAMLLEKDKKEKEYKNILDDIFSENFAFDFVKKTYNGAKRNFEFLSGEDDLFILKEHIEELAKIHEVDYEILPKTGHAIIFERPNEVFNKISKTLTKLKL